MIKLGDCLEGLRALPDNSVDSIVTDPPYGLKFMGKAWDYDVPPEEVWRECLRVLKPGGHLLCFAGTRTQHRMAVRIEDAGFEIRDMIAWVYGSGFPKSADVSKHLDAHERKTWLDVAKAIDNADKTAMLTAWKEYSKTASGAGLSFVKSETATGTNMQKSGSAPESVLLQANPESNDAIALVAELSLTVAHRTNGVSCSSVQSPAEKSTTGLRGHATSAESRLASREAILDMLDSSALQNAWGWQDESMVDKLKAVEVLKIWLGRKKSSDAAATSALCAALTDDLKHIILSQSKTYRDAGTIQQTAFASAITATITESTAESLISFTVDTLRSKAIDKAAGAEREVVGSKTVSRDFTAGEGEDIAFRSGRPGQTEVPVTAAATPEAQRWEGWGTALKPALEPITLARKPLDGTVATNVLAHGTGALNIDGCRVEGAPAPTRFDPSKHRHEGWRMNATGAECAANASPLGRWPANLILSVPEDQYALRDDATPDQLRQLAEWMDANS